MTLPEQRVYELLKEDTTGHDWNHIQRVRRLSRQIAEREQADAALCDLIALLHDVDDYKLVGKEDAGSLYNARRILKESGISPKIAESILSDLAKMGYSKSMLQIEPALLESRIVQDADFLDALGIEGILRTYDYGKSRGQIFFEPQCPPAGRADFTAYTENETHAVQHFFDKLLYLDRYMSTAAARREAEKRIDFLFEFLQRLFEEENAQEWLLELDSLRKNRQSSSIL